MLVSTLLYSLVRRSKLSFIRQYLLSYIWCSFCYDNVPFIKASHVDVDKDKDKDKDKVQPTKKGIDVVRKVKTVKVVCVFVLAYLAISPLILNGIFGDSAFS
jgi:hypothetical protein